VEPARHRGLVLMVWDNDPMPAPDPLTELLVASGFKRRMEAGLGRMRRGTSPGATLLSIDLDAFKVANDRHGHAVGDEILRTIGQRLRAQARRPGDLAGRLGGDELALFLPGLTDVEVAVRRAGELRAAIGVPVPTAVGPLSVGASIGVHVIQAWGGVPSVASVLRRADQAMYLAKHAGGGVHLYDPSEPPPFEDGAGSRR
jgi:diguanylate cyclase (GGDEF)-like protein